MNKNTVRVMILSGLCLIWAACDLFPSEPPVPFTITLLGSKSPRPERYLLGEPIRMRATLENRTDEPVTIAGGPLFGLISHGAMQLRITGDEPGPLLPIYEGISALGIQASRTLEPRERIVGYLNQPWILGPGRYEIWIEYAPAGRGWDRLMEREGIPNLQVESNRFRFEIVEPSGIDAQAFAKYGDKRFNRLPGSHELREKLVREFPASVYAGWVISGGTTMMAMGPLARPAEVPQIPFEEHVRERELERVRRTNEGRLTRYAARIEELSSYLDLRPDFSGADEMRFGIAWLKLYLGEAEEAEQIVDRLVDTEDLPLWLREQCSLLREDVLKRIEGVKASGDGRSKQ
ncbi:MAG: hypothetical protein K8R59_04815 [Thermoanaerobaculales bacterium]|nr:hypothetical protein [Thermoanaerobaculales bacterium]